jgi:hypothetical protein
MNFAILDDGRKVVVDSSRNQTRMVGGKEFFLGLKYVNVLLDGGWQTVKKERLKPAEYGSPFTALRP